MADKSDPLNPTLRASQLSQATVETDHSGVPKLNIVQGLVMAPGITEESLKDIQERFTYRDDDLFIATPPKCGTTWIQQIVKLIRNNGVESGVDSDVAIPWFEQMTVEEIEAVPSPRAFKSHLPAHLLPKGDPKSLPSVKFISAYRNPKDLIVSIYYMISSFMKHIGKVLPFDAFMPTYYHAISTHLEQMKHWWLERDSPNILLMCYEDMKKDLTSAVAQIATFMGYSLTDDIIKSIAEATTFDKMKDNPAASKHVYDAEFNKDGSASFMRKGEVGDWKNHLSEEQSAKIDTLVEKHLAGTGLVFQYE